MSRSRWGSSAPEDERDARRLLLDAAERCFERHEASKTTVEDIAKEAHVGRATVYRYFTGGRNEIVMAVALRDLARIGRRLMEKFGRSSAHPDAVVEGVLLIVNAARESPKVALLFEAAGSNRSAGLVGGHEALTKGIAGFIEPFVAEGRQSGAFRADLDTDEAAEWFTRVIASLLAIPSTRGAKDERRYLREFLLPAFLPR